MPVEKCQECGNLLDFDGFRNDPWCHRCHCSHDETETNVREENYTKVKEEKCVDCGRLVDVSCESIPSKVS